jgi:3-dehydroquinate synthase
MTDVRIAVTAERQYDVVIGRGILGELPPMIAGASRAAVIHPASLTATAEGIRADLESDGINVVLMEIPDAEDAKKFEVLAFCWSALGQSGFTRNDVIIAVGGGATTDLAGFVAASWLRGIRFVNVPTTLAGMVDAAIGGKTGINTAEGKNLVGAFHSPAGVLCDLTALGTLPRNDLIAGMAEVVKVGLTSDRTILDDVLSSPEACLDPASGLLASLIARAVQVKADVVSSDFREVSGREGRLGREVLNYGHTFGHAVEKVERYRWRHGAAVSVGLMFVAELARLAGRLSDEDADLHRQALTSLGLPVTYAPGRWPELFAAMQVDKKARGSLLRFVVLERIGEPMILEGPDPVLLAAAYDAVSNA